jgi:hypothetical protein
VNSKNSGVLIGANLATVKNFARIVIAIELIAQ